MTKVEPVGMPPGTRVEVVDLFFNTPARLKYLRSVATEQARCIEVVQKAALARPDVAFRCEVNGQSVFRTSGRGDPLEVLAALHGVGEARQMLKVEASTSDYQVVGWIGRPTQAKASRTHGHLFVNHRPIRNLSLHQGVVAGYHHRLMINRHPVYALHIDLDPGLVDVNIHPHKAEVRFSEERDLVQVVQSAVARALDEATLIPEVSARSLSGRSDHDMQTRLSLQQGTASARSEAWGRQPATGEVRERPYSSAQAPRPQTTGAKRTPWSSRLAPVLAPLQVTAPDGADTDDKAPASANGPDQRRMRLQLRPIGQALGMYILADDGDFLYIIDQHAAHERVLYERFSHALQTQAVHSMPLLASFPVHVTLETYAVVNEQLEAFAEMGLALEPFGGIDFIVRSIPTIWEGLDAAKLMEDLIASLSSVQTGANVRDVLRDMVVSKACKAAIKANSYLSDVEIKALCDAVVDLEDPFHCPHGRPILIRLSNRDLEKEFRRIV